MDDFGNLDELVEKLKKSEFCVPDGGGNSFVISEDDHIALDDYEVLIVLCRLLGVPIHEN